VGVRLELLAQPTDVHVDRPHIPDEVVPPDVGQQVFPAAHLAGMLQQEGEEVVLLGLEPQFLLVAPDAALTRIKPEVADDHRRDRLDGGRGVLARPRDPAQRRLDAGDEFPHGERLGHVVVGAHREPDDAVHYVGLGREHQDGHLAQRRRVGAADGPAHRQPIQARQEEVQHDQVGLLALGGAKCALAIGGSEHGVAVATQDIADRADDGRIVVGDEDARHGKAGLGKAGHG
jgi:hypothetical protein